MTIRGLIVSVLLVFGVLPQAASAATLYMQPHSVELRRGETASIEVRLNTDDEECINVIDAVIAYPSNIEPVDTSRGRSILSMWVEDPVIDKANRTITFAGGIPNGYCGRIPGDPELSNVVIELLFRSPGMVIGAVADQDTADISFGPETKAWVNDGFGTVAELATLGTTIHLSKEVGTNVSEWTDRVGADTIPPEKFTIYLERTPNAFSNDYYIVFNTTDKQSGIDHYEVIEEPLEDQMLFTWGAATAPWVKARSPYVLKDQSLNSTIRVRAIDKAGNEYIATLIPEESERSMSLQSKIMIALVATTVIVFVAAVVFALFWYRRRTNADVVLEDDQLIEPEE